jgi:cysteine-rich repeat protein
MHSSSLSLQDSQVGPWSRPLAVGRSSGERRRILIRAELGSIVSCVSSGVLRVQYRSTLWSVALLLVACGSTTEGDPASSSPAELGGASGSAGALISGGAGGGTSDTAVGGQPGSLCGNGVLDPGEQCDGSPPGGCTPECCLSTSHWGCWPRPPACGCGDGVVASDEQCDDGNVQNGDGCNQLCELELGNPCGNGVIDEGELCDDGANEPFDGCDPFCQLDTVVDCDFVYYCGDGLALGDEECDDGNTHNGDGCDELCHREVQP